MKKCIFAKDFCYFNKQYHAQYDKFCDESCPYIKDFTPTNKQDGTTDEGDNSQRTKRVNCPSATAGYERIAWSRSMSEEVIGTLWCIVAILAYGFGIKWLMWGAGAKALSDQIAAIYFAIKETSAVKRALSRQERRI